MDDVIDNVLNPNFRQVAIKGKNKTFFRNNTIGEFIMLFEGNDATINLIRNKLSQVIFELLTDCFVANHFIKMQGLKEQQVLALEMIPIIIIVNSFTSPDMANRLHCSVGMRLKNYIIELYLKNTINGLVSPEHVIGFEWINKDEWKNIYDTSKRVMDIIYAFFKAYGIVVTSIKLEFGRAYKDGQMYDIFIADEMSQNNISFLITDMPDEDERGKYIEIAHRLGILK